MPFLDSLDIANLVCQHCGVPQILDVAEDSRPNFEVSFAYDNVRRAELQKNNWTFSTRRVALRALDDDTMLLAPVAWDNTVTYSQGAIIADVNGELWHSLINENLGNDPLQTDVWDKYYGPMTASLYDSTIAYWAGELVYKTAGNPGGFVIFRSLQNANDSDPATADAYDATITYQKGNVVSNGGFQWRSLIELNLGVTPAQAPGLWTSNAAYSTTTQVTGSDGYIYTGLTNGNVNNDPVTDDGSNWLGTGVPAAWTKVPTIYPSAKSWLPIAAGMSNMAFQYPIGAGPSNKTSTRNVFRLPAGFLKTAPQDPKAGSTSFLGSPSGLPYTDWLIEGGFIVTRESGPILFRFIADITKVTSMDDLFCKGFAAAIALQVVEPLTQSVDKTQAIASQYNKFISDAKIHNFIEMDAIEPPEDDYITCRQ